MKQDIVIGQMVHMTPQHDVPDVYSTYVYRTWQVQLPVKCHFKKNEFVQMQLHVER